MRTKLFVILALVGFLLQDASGQSFYNIRGMGMAQTAAAVARGTDAIGINPANVALPEWNAVTLSVGQTGFKIRTELFTYDIYQNYFTGVPDSTGTRVAKHLTNADKNTILSQIPDLAETRFQAVSMLCGATIQSNFLGGLGFAAIEHVGATFTLSKDYFRMVAFGFDSLGSSYNFQGTSAQAWWYREYNFSYGRKLPITLPFLKDIYAGVGIKLIRGYGIFETERYNTSFSTVVDPSKPYQYTAKGNFDFLVRRSGVQFLNGDSGSFGPKFKDYQLFSDPVGKGTGVDVGFSGQLLNGIRLAVSVTDIGKITWDKDIIETVGGDSVTITNPFTDLNNNDSIKTNIRGKNRPGETFTTPLPTALHVGMMVEASQVPFLKFLPGNLLLAADYLQGFNESLGNTTKPRLSVGMEYRIIPLIPLRTGLSLGGGDTPRWAFGFGLDMYVVSLDFATDNFGVLFSPKNFQMFSASFGMKIRI